MTPDPNDPNQRITPPVFEFPEFDNSAALESLALAREQFEWQKAQAEERKRNIAESLAAIEELFAERHGVYDSLKKDSRRLNLSQLNQVVMPDAERQMRFALARSGNIGGSVDVDKNAEMARRMGLARGNIDIFAQGQSDALRAQDQSLRGALSAMAASGGLTGDITRKQGASALRGLSGTASYLPGLNDVFSGLSDRIGGAGRGYNQPAYGVQQGGDRRLQPWV